MKEVCLWLPVKEPIGEQQRSLKQFLVGRRKTNFGVKTQRFGHSSKMSGAHEQERKRRPSKTFLISADLRVHDAMEGSILLKRGSFCLEQDLAKSKTDQAWVKVHTPFLVKHRGVKTSVHLRSELNNAVFCKLSDTSITPVKGCT